jgi:hypothetical protein
MKRQMSTVAKGICFSVFAMICLGSLGQLNSAFAGSAGHAKAAVWADDQLFDVILTDTSFKSPPPQSTDVIFSFAASGLSGQRSVAESAPGDPDYNGGRWTVFVVTFTELGKSIHDPDGDGVVDFELTNAEDVLHHAELGHLTLQEAGIYFECPLLPRRGQH